MTSAIGQLILYLNASARAEGRVTEYDETAKQVLDTLRSEDNPRGRLPQGVVTGLELRRGSAHTPEAKAIRAYALGELRSYDRFLHAVDTIGYTPQLVRAALTLHWEQLEADPLGSDGNCVLLDIQQAVAKATPTTRAVVAHLIKGDGPQQIGEALDTNGSRVVGRALKEVSRILEGCNGTPTRRRG
jgi:hypothetical protein